MKTQFQSRILIYPMFLFIANIGFSQPTLLKDIKPGPQSSMSQFGPIKIGDLLFFSADDGINGSERWVTDGTSSGTIKAVENTTVLVDTIFSTYSFLGKTQGTQIVSALPSGIFASVSQFRKVNDGWFFLGNCYDSSFTGLWKTDGTDEGAVMVKQFALQGTSNLIASPDGTKLFFTTGNNSNSQLWQSDGTTVGTVIIKSFNNTPRYEIGAFVNLNNDTFFRANGPSNYPSIWKIDGTTTGTVLIYEKLSIGFSPGDYIVYKNKIYFSGSRQGPPYGHQFEIFVSDGTTEGTNLFFDINPGPSNSSFPAFFMKVNDLLIFRANTPETGQELWVTNGSTDGTFLLHDIFPGTGAGVSTGSVIPQLNKFLFTGVNGNERTLWETDGTVAGTIPLYNVSESNTLIYSNAGYVNNKLIFIKQSVAHGNELWSAEVTLTQNEFESNKGVFVYPNPATNILTIENSYTGSVHISVMNQLGKVVLKKIQDAAIKSLDVSNLSKGLYFLNINFEDGNSQTIKFIKD